MEFTSLNEGTNFLTYPANKVIGILSTPEELHAAVTELNNAGFQKEQLQVLCGEKGAERLDPTGERHGFLARLYRFVEKFGDMESKHLSEYKSELLRGHFLLAIDVAAEVDRARVLNVLKTHRATRVNFFGKWTVEGLSSE
jgi:hypothetical protein